MPEVYGLDAHAPREVAARMAEVGVTKANLPLLSLVLLAVAAGAFVGLGAFMSMLVASDTSLGFAVSRFLGGLAFSLGLILVSVAGAELFTGNNLIVMAWASKRISAGALLRNWGLACVGNAMGAAGMAALVALSGRLALNQGAVAEAVIRTAQTKAQLGWQEAFFSAMLCNVLVCMAVWMAMAGRSLGDKVVAIVFPITAFAAAGFEHSIANLFIFPLAAFLGAAPPMADMARNLLSVFVGNIVGGSVLVAGVYWVIYLRASAAPQD